MKTVATTVKKIMLKEPFYGLFLCGVNKKFTEEVDTACAGIDGINPFIGINKDYWENLEKPEYKYATLKHEILHIAFGHIFQSDDWHNIEDNHILLNVAMDLEVESYIDENYWVRKNGELTGLADFLFESFPSLDKQLGTIKYLQFLKQLSKLCNQSNGSNNSKGASNSSSKGQSNSSSSSSSKDQQKNSSDNSSENQSGNQSDGSSKGQSDSQSSNQQGQDNSNIEKDWNNLSPETQQKIKDQLDAAETLHKLWKKVQSMSNTEKKLAKNQIDHQIEDTAKNTARGLYPKELSQIIDAILTPKKALFNWKAYFRRLLGVSYDIYPKKTRRKESNRFPDSMGLKKNKKHNILVGIDTSGSVSNKDYVDFFSEINNIYKAGANIHILECDTSISAEYDFKGKLPSQRSSCGGTSFLPVIDYFNQHRGDYTACVYLTDGYGDQNQCHPLGKMIWIITNNGYKDSNYPGFKICIPENY